MEDSSGFSDSLGRAQRPLTRWCCKGLGKWLLRTSASLDRGRLTFGSRGTARGEPCVFLPHPGVQTAIKNQMPRAERRQSLSCKYLCLVLEATFFF